MELIKRNWMPLVLIAAGVLTRLLFIWWPDQVVFDEVHSGKIAASYFTGEFSFFEIHPPLSKLLVAFVLWLSGFQPVFGFANIGDQYVNVPYVAFRLLPGMFGALIPLAAFWVARELNFSKLAAFSAGLLLVLDNALITHSRVVVFDSFMLLFGLAGLAAFLRARKENYDGTRLALAGIGLGGSIATKWTGLAFLAAALAIVTADAVRDLWTKGFSASGKNLLISSSKAALGLIVLPFVIYIAAFAVHFLLITKPGAGDAFVSRDFPSKSFPQKLIELHKAMYTSAKNLPPHPYASAPLSWPLVVRPVYYWNAGTAESMARVYLIGNPAVWWGSTLFGFLALLFWRPRGNLLKKWLFVGLWLTAMLPLILAKSTLFLYHYFTALIAAVMLTAGWLGGEPRKRIKILTLYAVLAVAFILFIYFAPLTYGFYLTEAAFKSRLWLPGWL